MQVGELSEHSAKHDVYFPSKGPELRPMNHSAYSNTKYNNNNKNKTQASHTKRAWHKTRSDWIGFVNAVILVSAET